MDNLFKAAQAADPVRKWAMGIKVTDFYADDKLQERAGHFSVPCGVCPKEQTAEFCQELVQKVTGEKKETSKEARIAAQARCIELMIKAFRLAAGEPNSQETVEEVRDKVLAAMLKTIEPAPER